MAGLLKYYAVGVETRQLKTPSRNLRSTHRRPRLHHPNVQSPAGTPGYYETHSANDVVWRTAPVARLFFDEELVSLLVKAFNLGAWGDIDNAHHRQNRRSVLNREGDLEGRYCIGKKLIIITSDHPYGKPTVKDEADALADPRALDQPARAGLGVVTA